MFVNSSRYAGLPDQTWTSPEGVQVVYKSRRLIPRPRPRSESLTAVGQGERLDLVTARTIGLPELFWKVCDVNGALDPFELVEPGGRLLWVPEG
jgi:hypothetical protein